MGNAALAEFAELGGKRDASGLSVFEDDEGLWLDQTFLIKATNDGRLDDVGMFDKFGFNLEWRAPDAANLQHVIAAAAVVEIAPRVTTTGVSGIEPAIDHRRRGAFGIVPITARRSISRNEQLTALVVADLDPVLVNDACAIP